MTFVLQERLLTPAARAELVPRNELRDALRTG
jgi:hypothetical protein